MTRQEAIAYWKGIVKAVLVADEELQDEWLPKLRDVMTKSSEEQIRVADEYVTAVATQVLSKTRDEELKEFNV